MEDTQFYSHQIIRKTRHKNGSSRGNTLEPRRGFLGKPQGPQGDTVTMGLDP